MKPTQKEIEAEIAALEACKSYIPRMTGFGDNNFNYVDAQIEELKFGVDDTADEWNYYSERDRESVMEARDWKDGQESKAPSSGWDSYKPKPI